MTRSQAARVTTHIDLATHPKMLALCTALGVSRPHAVGIVTLLWHHCARNSLRDGALHCTQTLLAEDLYWRGNPHDLFDALLESGFIDAPEGDGQYVVHEFEVYLNDAGVSRKGRKEAKRLSRLREEERTAVSLLGDEPPLGVPAEVAGIYDTLMGKGSRVGPNDAARIARTLERFPRQSGLDVALDYMGWQLDVARRYREKPVGAQPHTDPIRGWSNQMAMHAKKGWSLRDQPVAQTKSMNFTEEDARKYG